jgi:glycosyltransferase involved in cell wall biosynthesis
MHKLSVIISVYNKIHELELILAALEHQSFHDFEVIIADDGSGTEMQEFIDRKKKKSKLKINHLWQEDKGFRKNKILNKSITSSQSDYLIFLDGDCLPHSDFINEHYKNRSAKTVLCGSRVNMSKKLSQAITLDAIRSKEYEGGMLGKIIDSFRDKDSRSTYVEEGIYIGSDIIHKIIRKRPRLIGCNFSVPKELMLKINGFDENYTGAGVGEDSDIEFRLKLAGAEFESVRNKAIVYHFYHPHTKENKENYAYFEKVKQSNTMLCQNGIDKLNI